MVLGACCVLLAACCVLRAACCVLLAACCLLLTPLPLTTHCLLPTTQHFLLATYYLPLTTHQLLPLGRRRMVLFGETQPACEQRAAAILVRRARYSIARKREIERCALACHTQMRSSISNNSNNSVRAQLDEVRWDSQPPTHSDHTQTVSHTDIPQARTTEGQRWAQY